MDYRRDNEVKLKPGYIKRQVERSERLGRSACAGAGFDYDSLSLDARIQWQWVGGWIERAVSVSLAEGATDSYEVAK